MNIATQIRLRLQLKGNSEVEYKSAAGGFPKAEFWRSFSTLAERQRDTPVRRIPHQTPRPRSME